MSKEKCPRGCGKSWEKGDAIARAAHTLACSRQVWNGGAIAGKHAPFKTNSAKK